MWYYDLPEEGLEAIKENALSNYLPFNGGFRQHYQIRNFGKNKKPKGKVRFYAVEYRPDPIKLEKSPIHLNSKTTFNKFDQSIRERTSCQTGKNKKDWLEYWDYYDKIKYLPKACYNKQFDR